ncbi:zyxin-like [Micropterus dolomieu]|uniref:zyxin-like n=1 Tax=Micropterus dolomieu TaxID=147949 RepID=UPI001E8CB789|nr:zyxin-like [Micropterus dolomieu]
MENQLPLPDRLLPCMHHSPADPSTAETFWVTQGLRLQTWSTHLCLPVRPAGLAYPPSPLTASVSSPPRPSRLNLSCSASSSVPHTHVCRFTHPLPQPSQLCSFTCPLPTASSQFSRASSLPQPPHFSPALLSQSPRFPVPVFPRNPPPPQLQSLNPIFPQIKPVNPQSCVWVHSVPTLHNILHTNL